MYFNILVLMLHNFIRIFIVLKPFIRMIIRDLSRLKLLTSIAGLVHVNDLNLMTLILVSLCHICSVYAIKEFGYPPRIFHHFWIFLWVLALQCLFNWHVSENCPIGILFMKPSPHPSGMNHLKCIPDWNTCYYFHFSFTKCLKYQSTRNGNFVFRTYLKQS